MPTYNNKVVLRDGTVVLDVTPTTAVESDVASGKIFVKADGSLGTGTSSGGGGGGSITQDQDGYLVLSPNGGGGGGSTWSWAGENPTVVKQYTDKVYLEDTGYATWTPSTTSTKIVNAANLGEYTGADFTAYDYVMHFRFHSHFEYGAGATGTAQVSDTYSTYEQSIYGVSSNYTAITDNTLNTVRTASGNLQNCSFYLTSSGNQGYAANVACGVYLYSTGSISSYNFANGTFYPNFSQINAVCSNTYFSTTNAAAVNQSTSYYEYRCFVIRVDHGTSNGCYLRNEIRDMWLNGI